MAVLLAPVLCGQGLFQTVLSRARNRAGRRGERRVFGVLRAECMILARAWNVSLGDEQECCNGGS